MLTFALQPLAACFGTIAFCIFFRVPAKYFPTCGLIGAISWIIYLAANTGSAITGNTSLAVTNFLAAFKAAFAIAIAVSIGVMIPTKYFAAIERRFPRIPRKNKR